MGIIRGGALAIVSVLLFIAFIVGNLLLTISFSLNYDNVQEGMQNIVSGALDNEIGLRTAITQHNDDIAVYCESYDNYVLEYEGKNLIVPCETFKEGPDAIIHKGVSDFIYNIYYADYNCDFLDCFKQKEIPYFLVSAQSQKFFYQKFNLILLALGVLAILGFILAEKKSNFFILTSVLLIIASLPFAKFKLFTGLFGSVAGEILSVFFAKAYDVFFASIIVGISLLILGFILKLFHIGFKISSIFQKKDKEIVEGKEKIVKVVVEQKEEKKEPKEKPKEKKKEENPKDNKKEKKENVKKKKPSSKKK